MPRRHQHSGEPDKVSRARRRSEKERMKRKAERIGLSTDLADHLKSCSCYLCGNARKHHGPTRQELREDL